MEKINKLLKFFLINRILSSKKKEGLGRVEVCYFSLGQDDGMAGMQDRGVQMCESI